MDEQRVKLARPTKSKSLSLRIGSPAGIRVCRFCRSPGIIDREILSAGLEKENLVHLIVPAIGVIAPVVDIAQVKIAQHVGRQFPLAKGGNIPSTKISSQTRGHLACGVTRIEQVGSIVERRIFGAKGLYRAIWSVEIAPRLRLPVHGRLHGW